MAVQTTNTIEFENLDELMQKIKELQSSNPRMKKQLNAMMREVIRQAVKEVKAAAKSELPNDPRKAFNAVRSSVYKRILGGQVNILARKKNNGKMYVGEKKRTLKQGQRGGNRRPVSERTKQIEGYYGSDRGFILRFLNAGTDSRQTRYGNRGSITARNWFTPSSSSAIENASEQFSELFDRAIVELWNE